MCAYDSYWKGILVQDVKINLITSTYLSKPFFECQVSRLSYIYTLFDMKWFFIADDYLQIPSTIWLVFYNTVRALWVLFSFLTLRTVYLVIIRDIRSIWLLYVLGYRVFVNDKAKAMIAGTKQKALIEGLDPSLTYKSVYKSQAIRT